MTRRLGIFFRRTVAAITGAAGGAIALLLIGGSATPALPLVLAAIGAGGALVMRVRETPFELARRELDDLESRLARASDPEVRAMLLGRYEELVGTDRSLSRSLESGEENGRR